MSSRNVLSDVKGDEYISAVIGETDSNENVKAAIMLIKNVGGIEGISLSRSCRADFVGKIGEIRIRY